MPGPHQGTGKFVSTVPYSTSDSCIHNIMLFMKLELNTPPQPWNGAFLLALLDTGISGFGCAFPPLRIRNIHLPLCSEAPVLRMPRTIQSTAFPHWKQADLPKQANKQKKTIPPKQTCVPGIIKRILQTQLSYNNRQLQPEQKRFRDPVLWTTAALLSKCTLLSTGVGVPQSVLQYFW